MTTVNSQKCRCTVCGLVTHSIPGTTHRRCGGGPRANLRPKLSREDRFVSLRGPHRTKHRPPRGDGQLWEYVTNSGGATFAPGPGPHVSAGTWSSFVS